MKIDLFRHVGLGVLFDVKPMIFVKHRRRHSDLNIFLFQNGPCDSKKIYSRGGEKSFVKNMLRYISIFEVSDF